MKTKTKIQKIPLITCITSKIRSKIIIILLFIIVTIGIIVFTTQKNIEEGLGGINHPTITTNFFQRSASNRRDKPSFLGEIQESQNDKKQQQQQQQQQQQNTRQNKTSETSETPETSETSEKPEKPETPETSENLKEIIISILAPLGTIIKLPDKTNIK